MNIETIYVENIKCGGCMNTIKSKILSLTGVSDIKIDKELDQITVLVEGRQREEIIDELIFLGYPEKGNNTTLAKAKSFISCAIGRINSDNQNQI